MTLRIYPRAKDIDSTYTGCQVLLAPEKDHWIVISLTEIVKGDPIRIWSPYENKSEGPECRFKQGKVVQGNPNKCPAPEYLLIKSMAPGCVLIIQEAVTKQGLGVPIPLGCEYQ